MIINVNFHVNKRIKSYDIVEFQPSASEWYWTRNITIILRKYGLRYLLYRTISIYIIRFFPYSSIIGLKVLHSQIL